MNDELFRSSLHHAVHAARCRARLATVEFEIWLPGFNPRHNKWAARVPRRLTFPQFNQVDVNAFA
jgi:hypothetical protein